MAQVMFIVQNGVVEVTTEIDGIEFVIERLYRGSVINHRSFLLADNIDSGAKCATPVTLLYLTFDVLTRKYHCFDFKDIRNKSRVLD